MDWAKDLSALGSMLGGLGVVGAVIGLRNTAGQLREAENARHAAAAAGFSRQWRSKTIQESRRAVGTYRDAEALKLGFLDGWDTHSSEFMLFDAELNFFEELGVTYKLRGISLEWIRETLGSIVMHRWTIWEPTVLAMRLKDQPTAYENFENLATTLTRTARPTRNGPWRHQG